MKAPNIVLLGGLFWGLIFSSATGARAEAYRLAPQDLIEVRTVVWNDEVSTYEPFDAISGEFMVGPEGAVSLPIVGTVEARGMTVGELADRVAERLQSRLRFAEDPSIAIEVAEFRPVYVVGDVQTPGGHPYRPGMTVIQAVALAGGAWRGAAGDVGGQRESVRAVGTLRAARIEIVRLRVRAARLEAERDNRHDISFPASIVHPEGPGAAEALLAEERRIFEARREALDREIEAIEELKTLLNTEIEALGTKGEGLSRQLDRLREAVGNLEDLVDKGLARAPALLDQQRTLVELEGRELDMQTAAFRSRQRLSEAERDIVDLRARRQVEAVAELQRTRAEIEQLEERERTAVELIATTGALPGAGVAGALATPLLEFSITREDGEGATTLPAGRDMRVQPGDVIAARLVLDTVAPAN